MQCLIIVMEPSSCYCEYCIRLIWTYLWSQSRKFVQLDKLVQTREKVVRNFISRAEKKKMSFLCFVKKIHQRSKTPNRNIKFFSQFFNSYIFNQINTVLQKLEMIKKFPSSQTFSKSSLIANEMSFLHLDDSSLLSWIASGMKKNLAYSLSCFFKENRINIKSI